MRSAAPQKVRSGNAFRKSVINALMSSRPRRGSWSEYCRSMAGAASSSTIPRLQVLPQKSVNHRPTMALLSSSFDTIISPVVCFGLQSAISGCFKVDLGDDSRTPVVVGKLKLAGGCPAGCQRTSESGRDFPVYQRLLAFDAPTITRHRSTVAHDAMTGDCQGDWILRAGLRDRSQRFGAAHLAGELRVGEGPSEQNRAKRIPNAALEWRAANVEVKVERIARHSDELQNLGQVSAKSAVVRDNPAPREASSQILLHLFGRRAKPNCANADWAARDKNFPKGAVADYKLDFVRGATRD